MDNIIASNICYGTGGSNNWSDQLTEVSLAYNNSVVYLKFSFDKSISSCDELKIKIKDDPGTLQAGAEVFNICISVFENNEDLLNLYSNSNVYPSHSGLIDREYTTYTKNIENEYTISTSKMINMGPGIEYIMMIGSYDNEYGTSAGLKVTNTSVEGIIATRTITYDMNTGNGEPEVITVNKGDTITITDNIPIKDGNTITTTFEIKGMDNYADSLGGSTITATKKEGTFYRFLGWSDKPNSIAAIYDNTSQLTIFNDTVLYAIWEEYVDTEYENNKLSDIPVPYRDPIIVAHKVRLDPNNGDEVMEHNVGTSTEYIFKGWVSSGQGTEIIDMNTEYFESITVYALWETVFSDNSSIYLPIVTRQSTEINSYVVTVDANGGILSTEDTDITSKRRIEYIFDCWSTSSENKNPVDLFYTPNDDITLYATYNTTTRIMPIELPIATKEGYIFTGWNEVKDSGVNVVLPYTPSAHITLYAHFVSKNKLKMHVYHNGKWHHIIM